MKTMMLLSFVLLSLYVHSIAGVVFNPNNTAVRYTGRHSASPTGTVFDWPGVRASFSFTGPSCSVVLQDIGAGQSIVKVFLNQTLVQEITLTKTATTYQVATGLGAGSHKVVLIKRTEPLVGIVSFQSIILADGHRLAAQTPPYKRKVEFIGDSITCGYGILGKSPCGFTPATEDQYWTYESLVSRTFNTQMYVEAWSGKGVVRNCCNVNGTSPDPLPSIYGRTIANEAGNTWAASHWVPDAIVINLGTNDYSTNPIPSQDVFTKGYNNFIATLRTRYAPANPTLFLACGPMIADPCCSYVQQIANANNAHFINLMGLLSQNTDYGCDGHPSTIAHAKMANATAPVISKYMGWPLPL